MDPKSLPDQGIGLPMADFPTFEGMKGTRRWLLWKSVPQSGRKPLKVPHYVNGSTRGETDTPEDWALLTGYHEAKEALARCDDSWGLAFALGPDGTGGYWQGIDLDNIVGNRLADLANSVAGFVEISPSEQGAHAIGYGRDFASLGSNASGIEAYAVDFHPELSRLGA